MQNIPQVTRHKSLIAVALSATLFMPGLSSATGLNNGDFATNDFSAWSIDTDGFAGTTPDFQIIPSGSDHQARIEADYWPADNAWFANTLYQEMDLSATANQDLVLSFDWEFSGEMASFDENFLVALGNGTGNYFDADGNLGFLLNPLNYGSGTFTTMLDASFLNLTGWTLEFQMGAGFDGYGSFVNIDNVSLAAVDQLNAVPAPAAFWLFASGLIGMAGIRRRKVS